MLQRFVLRPSHLARFGVDLSLEIRFRFDAVIGMQRFLLRSTRIVIDIVLLLPLRCGRVGGRRSGRVDSAQELFEVLLVVPREGRWRWSIESSE